MINPNTLQIPSSRIANHPYVCRGSAKLLHIRHNQTHRAFGAFNDIVHLLKHGDLLVLNNTAVMPSTLMGYKKTGGKVSITVLEIISPKQAWVLLKSPPKVGSTILIDNYVLKIIQQNAQRFYLQLMGTENFYQLINQHGTLTLPPYIKRAVMPKDNTQYQTVFGNIKGSIAAPTASLHFNKRLLSRLQNKGVELGFLTLHVGLGTFLPIKTKHLQHHHMHHEYFHVPRILAKQIKCAKKQNRRIISAGTTPLRALESAATQTGLVEATQGQTNLFIYPGYPFKVIDGLITNFHRPDSTLIQLVSALAGVDAIEKAYQFAIGKRWRFFSYGDAMFIEK